MRWTWFWENLLTKWRLKRDGCYDRRCCCCRFAAKMQDGVSLSIRAKTRMFSTRLKRWMSPRIPAKDFVTAVMFRTKRQERCCRGHIVTARQPQWLHRCWLGQYTYNKDCFERCEIIWRILGVFKKNLPDSNVRHEKTGTWAVVYRNCTDGLGFGGIFPHTRDQLWTMK